MAFNEGPLNGFFATFVRIISATIIIWPLAVMAGKYDNAFAIYRKDRQALLLTFLGAFLGPFMELR